MILVYSLAVGIGRIVRCVWGNIKWPMSGRSISMSVSWPHILHLDAVRYHGILVELDALNISSFRLRVGANDNRREQERRRLAAA